METPVFPLRWESTGDQWWYASPIDWAAANGHFDIVRELLRIDPNLLIKLTSLRRIRRLETLWEGDDSQFAGVAHCRSAVARSLLRECHNKKGENPLIRAGYGGWLLYTAASAGDLGFVRELLEGDPLLVFGEGEYGVTDIFYAAARSKDSGVFRVLFDFAALPRGALKGRRLLGFLKEEEENGVFKGWGLGFKEEEEDNVSLKCRRSGFEEGEDNRAPKGRQLGFKEEEEQNGAWSIFRWEMMNRAVHAAARGGNLEVLKELLVDCSHILDYRDAQGSTLLHSAAGRGQTVVVKDLIVSFNITNATDNLGNTALHVAAYKGHLSVIETLIHASPSSTSRTNTAGDTFLHMLVAGFQAPGFRRLDRQIELMNKLLSGQILNFQEIVNIKNNNGRTALHIAVLGNVHSNLIDLLMSVPYIDLNIRDNNEMTPLDLLRKCPQSLLSDTLMKQLVSAGGISNSNDSVARDAMVSLMKMQGLGGSPGTSFRIPDSEIFLHTGFKNAPVANGGGESARPSSCSTSSTSKSENSQIELANANSGSSGNKKVGRPVDSAAKGLKTLLRWPRRKEKKISCDLMDLTKLSGDSDSMDSCRKSGGLEATPTSLRERFSKASSLPNNKRTHSVRISQPNSSTKKRFDQSLMHGLLQSQPQSAFRCNSASTPFSRSPPSPPTNMDKLKGASLTDNEVNVSSCSKESGELNSNSRKTSSANIQLMNQYFCFGGARDSSIENSVDGKASNQAKAYMPSLLSMT